MATKSELMAEAYRRGLLPPDRASLYEEAVKRGLVNDTYAAGRLQARGGAGGLVNAGLATLNRAIPGFSEATAGISAAGDAVSDALHGRTGPQDGFGADFNQERARQQGLVDELRQAHPIASNLVTGTGNAVPLVAGLATGGLTEAPTIARAGSQVVAKGLPALARRVATGTARNALTGSAISGVYGASQPGTVQERAANATNALAGGAAWGVGMGAGGGAFRAGARAVGAVGSRVGAVGSEMLDAASRAITGKSPMDQARPIPPEIQAQGQQAALAYLQRQGVTPEQLEAAKASANGKPITTAEAGGPALISQATGLARRAGATPALADATMTARGADRSARILNDIHETTGVDPEAAKGSVDSIVKNGQAAAGPLYDAIRSRVDPVWNDDLAELAARPVVQRAIGTASSSLLNAGKDPSALDWIASRTTSPREVQPGRTIASLPVTTETQTAEARPTAETWDLIKKHVAGQVERHPITGAPLPDSVSQGNHDIGVASADLTGALRSAIPGYGAALDTAGDYLSVKGAYDRGKGILFGSTKDPRDFHAYFTGLSPSEQNATRASLANDIFAKVNNGQLRPGSFDAAAVQQKLVTAFGPDAAQALVSRMTTEANMSRASARMTPNMNSTTGDVIGADADRGDADTAIRLAGAGVNALSGRPIAAIRGVAGAALPFVSAARQPLGMATRNALGGMLYQDPATTAAAMRSSMNAISLQPTDQTLPRSVTALTFLPSMISGQNANANDPSAAQ